MDAHPDSNRRTQSTTYALKRVRITRRPAANKHSRRQASSLARRDKREPLTITVRYRGGPEAWWEIKARGQTLRYPGWLDLNAVLCEIYGVHPDHP